MTAAGPPIPAPEPESLPAGPTPPAIPARKRRARAGVPLVRRGLKGVGAWLLRQRIVQMFVADRPLAIATAACALVTLAPLFFTTFLPLVDMGSNIGAAGLMGDAAFGNGLVAQRYRVNWSIVPYWSVYAVMSLLAAVVGPFIAAKLIVAIGVVLVPLSAMRLLVALGRSPRLGLWAFLLAWDTNLYWGWVTFQIGVPVALWVLACLIETDSWKRAAKLIPWSLFVALTHLHAVVLLGLAALFQALVRPRRLRALGQAAVALAGFFILVPWVLHALHPGASGHMEFALDTLPDRLKQLFRFTLDVITSPVGETLTGLAFVLFIVGPPAVAALPRVATPPRSGAIALAILLAAAGLYMTLPFAMSGTIDHYWTYPRYGTYLLLALLLLPAPDLGGRRVLALAPGLALVAALSVARVQQFAAYDARTRPYLSIIQSMKRDSSFLPLDFDLSWSGTREVSLGQLHGYAAAARSLYDPHLFDNPNTPLVFRTGAQPPQPNWKNVRGSFAFEQQGQYYDYIVVHPATEDPLASYRGRAVEWVRDAGPWRLYRVLGR